VRRFLNRQDAKSAKKLDEMLRGYRPNPLTWTFAALFVMLALLAMPLVAQDNPVTDDQVNAVAGRMYCPVCENIPLDACGTDACIQWRREIRTQLEEGRTPDEVIADFVRRFGDRVVGTPQDPTLRALSLVTPVLIAGAALLMAIQVLLRWNRRTSATSAATAGGHVGAQDDDYYRARVEADLRARR
jgi:cytochrome c-type biogenesis protein CcmH